MDQSAVEFDHLVVGAGTAGCVLAARLSEEPGVQVGLVEAGPPDRSLLIAMPAGLRSLFRPSNRYNWWFKTTPQAGLNHRQVDQPRGRTLGGSSSINGMTWLRGHPSDYDEWAALGCTDWSFERCLPTFKALERCAHGDPKFRGRSGPVGISRVEELSPINAAFLDAGEQAGLPATDDPNGSKPEGFCRFDMSVAHGVRSSASRAYLRAALTRPNLTVETGALVRRLTIETGRATGVEVDGRVLRARSIILAAGAFGSPHLLMLSGIGPADHIRQHGIPVLADIPGVGANLSDHLEVHVQVRTAQPVGLNRELQLHRAAKAGLEWLLFKSGPAATAGCHVGALLRSVAAHDHRPDIQFHFFPLFFGADWVPRPGVHGYRLGAGPTRPESRGTVRLASADPSTAPLIDPAYLSTEHDIRQAREGLKLARETLRQAAFAQFGGQEDTPGSGVNTDSDLDAYIRANAASAYHPCGTCRMGKGADAVVDSAFEVRGVEGLRVVDASIIPAIPGANINAATFMIAERAAEAIRTQTD